MSTDVTSFTKEIIDDHIIITKDNFDKYIVDFTISLEDRMNALILFNTLRTEEQLSEVFSRIISIFTISNSFSIKEYIIAICKTKNFALDLRTELAKNFCESVIKPDNEFLSLYEVCQELDVDDANVVNTSRKIEAFVLLMMSQNFKENGKTFFNKLINNKNLNSLFRYKTILSLKTLFYLKNNENVLYFQKSALISFIENEANGLNERILSIQNLITQHNYRECLKIAIDICENKEFDYKSRADAVDVILKYGDDKEVGKQLLDKLILVGNDNKKPLNIYQNPQNAHSQTIEESSCKILEMIMSIPLIKIDCKEIVYDMVKDIILKDETKITLDRIDLDTALYTKFNTSLKSALTYMYSFIQQQDELKNVLMDRLVEELSESSGLCSTGIFERMMNCVSGFVGDLKITISFEDQIHGNLTGRLNARIRNIPNLDCLHISVKTFCNCNETVCKYSYTKKFLNHRLRLVKESACGNCYYCNNEKCSHVCIVGENSCNVEFMNLVLEEMIIPTQEYNRRHTFLKYFRYVLPYIIEELKEEFKPYIDDSTFELYMHRAIIAYEGEN